MAFTRKDIVAGSEIQFYCQTEDMPERQVRYSHISYVTVTCLLLVVENMPGSTSHAAVPPPAVQDESREPPIILLKTHLWPNVLPVSTFAFVGGLLNIDVSDKHLLLAASSARQKYLSYLEGEKKKKECSGRGQKCKLLNDEIDEIKKKK